MDRQMFFRVFVGAFVAASIFGILFEAKASPAVKRRLTPYLMVGGPVFFLTLTALAAGTELTFFVALPFFLALVLTAAWATRICDRCGATNAPNRSGRPRVCHRCGKRV
jgi:hypothetical protein